ncbi:MAG: hypothetical protein KGJ78_00805 [Alphaproteobacteria bacterium]|nr:hypothetical protein [Alphaproteobacteria bacterium]
MQACCLGSPPDLEIGTVNKTVLLVLTIIFAAGTFIILGTTLAVLT